jgi:hypothetical protein
MPWYLTLAEGVPPEIVGIPTWVLNGLSIAGLVSMIIYLIATDRLWTRGQVNRLIATHVESVAASTRANEKAISDQKDRYELHLDRTVQLLRDQVGTAERRESEWRTIAGDWQKVATLLGDAIDPLHAQSEAVLNIVREMQAYQQASAAARRGNAR